MPEQSAAELVAHVLAGRSLATTLPVEIRRLNQSGSARLQDIVMGTLRHLGTLRSVLQVLATRGVQQTRLEALILSGLYQLEFAKTPEHAVIHTSVEVARSMGFANSAGFVNAILRRFQREHATLMVAARSQPVGRWSHPQWWIDMLHEQYEARAEQILEAGLMHPPMCLRVNLSRTTVETYLTVLGESNISATRLANSSALLLDKPQSSRTLPGFNEGLVSVQDAAAQWAAVLLEAQPGQRVLDACAAPGGKSAHILERAPVELLALDSDAARLEDVRRNLYRLGLSAQCRVADARQLSQWWDGKTYDRILLDAPCSASGIVRRHPDAKWLRRAEDIPGFARTQAQLLDALWRVLTRGGKLLYATCSVFAQENAAIIAQFQDRTPDAIRLELAGYPEPSGQLLPEEEHDGFFYALLQKR